jgi:hypothetical protein
MVFFKFDMIEDQNNIENSGESGEDKVLVLFCCVYFVHV